MAPAGTRPSRIAALLLAAAPLAGCAALRGGAAPAGPLELDKLPARSRVELVRRGQVWHAIDTRSLDLLAGPPVKGALPFDAQVTCDYVKPDEPQGGSTPKFLCDLGGGDVVKVKYGSDNTEVYAEVAATRLLWALGFAADGVYPVRVLCRACPIEPWYFATEQRVDETHFEIATIERKVPGQKISTRDFEGWSWDEIDHVDPRLGGAPRAHRDALKLLAAFIQHSDNKPVQQRLLCPKDAVGKDAAGNETCARPLLYLNDVGTAFGAANFMNTSAMDLEAWAKVPVWKDPQRCLAHLSNSFTGNLSHPRVSEAGRRFLAERLLLLGDGQIRDIFKASRVDRRAEEGQVAVLDRWVEAFKKKREDVVRHHCPR